MTLSCGVATVDNIYVVRTLAGSERQSAKIFRNLTLWALFFFCVSAASASLANIQVTASGSPTGACTGSGVTIITPTQFNNASPVSWGTGAGQIGPGTTILVCGTFTGTAGQNLLFYFEGGGAPGNPLNFTCDVGTNITAPYWGGGSNAPVVVTFPYVNLNGSGCTIQNTANGSGLAYNAYSTGIWIAASNVTVENFTVSNICQHTSATDHNGCTGGSGNLPAAIITTGSNITVRNNAINDSAYGIFHNAGTSDSGVTISGNTINRCNQHIAVGTAQSSNSVSNVNIYANTLTNAVNWDDGVTDSFHHNGVFIFQGTGGPISNVSIYDNSIGGDFGVNDTSYIFIDPNSADPVSNILIYNNLLLNGSTSDGPANGFITGLGDSGTRAAYNNTIFCNGAGFAAIKTDSGDTIENNIISTCSIAIYVNSGTSLGASDYNVFYNLSGANPFYYAGTNYASLAAWNKGTGLDSHSQTGNPDLNSNGTLQSGSSAIGNGINLTGLTIAGLDSDYSGNSRPSSGAWTTGAYNFATAPGSTPTPPSSLTAIAH